MVNQILTKKKIQRTCGTIRKYLTLTLLRWRIWWAPNNASKWQMGFNLAFKGLKKTRTDHQMKFYKVVARPSLLYGSETWVITKRDMTGLEAAEMRFLSVTGYTRLDKMRSEVIRKELEISGIQDVRLKYKQNWINRLERMDNTRLPKHALNYKPRRRRDRGRPRKQWQCVDAETGQTT